MPKLVQVVARPPYRLWLQYDDGAQGEVDLSHLSGGEVFQPWKEESFFRSVTIGPNGAVEWGGQIDLCADALYLRLTGKTAEEIMPGLRMVRVSA